MGAADSRASAAIIVAGGGGATLGAGAWLVLAGRSVASIPAVQVWWVRRPVPPAKVLGLWQMLLGLGLVDPQRMTRTTRSPCHGRVTTVYMPLAKCPVRLHTKR